MGDSIISSFQRYEVKYFLTPEQRASLMPVLEAHFQMDEYGLHTISNLYYDTDNYEITRNSIDRPVYKEKLRVRAYGVPQPETGRVFVELKKKYEHVVYKRRIALPVAEADRLLNHGEDPPGADPQITHEIRHFHGALPAQAEGLSQLPPDRHGGDRRIRSFASPWIRSCCGAQRIWI